MHITFLLTYLSVSHNAKLFARMYGSKTTKMNDWYNVFESKIDLINIQ